MKVADLFLRNPLYILELSANATAREIERQAGKILGMMELEVHNSTRYPTPWGSQPRDAADVRLARAELRDPVRFHFHSFWFLEAEYPQAPSRN